MRRRALRSPRNAIAIEMSGIVFFSETAEASFGNLGLSLFPRSVCAPANVPLPAGVVDQDHVPLDQGGLH